MADIKVEDFKITKLIQQIDKDEIYCSKCDILITDKNEVEELIWKNQFTRKKSIFKFCKNCYTNGKFC